jgi:hypothetical protein
MSASPPVEAKRSLRPLLGEKRGPCRRCAPLRRAATYELLEDGNIVSVACSMHARLWVSLTESRRGAAP